MEMRKCKACGRDFASTDDTKEICYVCFGALKRLNGYAVPVIHGQWEKWYPPKHMILTGEEMLYRCSACTAKYADIGGYNYCPFCGAKMEIGTDEGQETPF